MADGGIDDGGTLLRLLDAVDRGEPGALGDLVDAVYPELKRLAHFQLVRERPEHTLSTTEIVHEAYMRMASSDGKWTNRKHFLRAAATVMRHLLVDHARKRQASKRGSGQADLPLQEDLIAGDDASLAVLALDHALNEVASIDPRLEQVIECRYFAGLSVRETAEALDISVRSVERHWQRAKAYLLELMEPDGH